MAAQSEDRALIEKYASLVLQMRRYQHADDFEAQNRLQSEFDELRRGLRKGGDPTHRMLRALAEDARPWVRLNAGVDLLYISEAEGMRVLESLLAHIPKDTDERTVPQGARAAIAVWRRGLARKKHE